MSTATGESVEVVVDVDLDAEVPCTVTTECPRSGVVAGRCAGCRKISTACEPCREYLDVEARLCRLIGAGLACAECDHLFPYPLVWLPL